MDKAKMIELKPCPFCGEEAIIADTYGPYSMGSCKVSCKSCPCAVEVYGSMKYAVETWNRRVGVCSKLERIKGLAEIDIIRNAVEELMKDLW